MIANLGYSAAFIDVSGTLVFNKVKVEYGVIIPLNVNESFTNHTSSYSSGTGVYIEIRIHIMPLVTTFKSAKVCLLTTIWKMMTLL